MENIKVGDIVVLASDSGRANALRMVVELITNDGNYGEIKLGSDSAPSETSNVHVAFTVGNDVIQRKIRYGALKLFDSDKGATFGWGEK